MKGKLFIWLCGIVLALILVGVQFVACTKSSSTPSPTPSSTSTETIVLKALTVFEPSRETMIGMTMLADKVNKRANGELKINIIGAMDVIPIPEQAQACKEGTIDLLLPIPGTFEDQMPQTIALMVTEMTPQEERSNGFYDWFNKKLQQNMNMVYICRAHANYGFYSYTNRKIVDPHKDFNGQQWGLQPPWMPFATALGANPILINEPDLYEAISRGVIDGYILPPDSVTGLGLAEVTKYCIDAKFYRGSNLQIMMNLDKWKSLPSHLQDLIIECGIEVEGEVGTYYGDMHKLLEKQIKDAGVEYVKLSPEDERWYLNLANAVLWDKAKEKNNLQDYEALRSFLKK